MKPDNDYYEVLQISRNADIETIHRVYRIMAGRFHPDNPRTGDTETFLLLRRAYQVLADPEQRAKYDSTRLIEEESPLPIFELKDFVHGLKGEVNRRLGVLSLLYNRRRANEDNPGPVRIGSGETHGIPARAPELRLVVPQGEGIRAPGGQLRLWNHCGRYRFY